MRLGEVLLDKGLISPVQLREALDAQLIYGGHLGTCLIELGYLTEDRLGQALQETFRIPCAPREMFQDIPRYVIGSVPDKIVEKHLAVPIRREEKILTVAMIDPKDLQAIDEIAFSSGYKIQPWIAPEVRIFQAMERYYDIPRRVRYVALCRQLDKGGPGVIENESSVLRLGELSVSRNHEGAAAAPFGQPSFTGSEPPPSMPQAAPDRPAWPTASSIETSLSTDKAHEHYVSELLCRAEDFETLANLALRYIFRGMARCVLFTVKTESATIWKTAGLNLDRSSAAGVSFSVTSEPVFGLLRGSDYYRGPAPPGGEYQKFFDTLQIRKPREMIVLPIYLNDRLVALFYGDGGPEDRIEGVTEEYRRLVQKLGLALTVVLIKRKIRTV